MNRVAAKLSPSICKLIRTDHSHVLMTFHKFEVDTSPERKRAIVHACCTALEIHAQLEEEIFYPALRVVAADNEALRKAKPEHDEMRRLITMLRQMEPDYADYDARFHELMRDVLHHVADEETMLLPAAELLLKDSLGELGAQMTKRRLEIAGPRAGEIARDAVRAMPGSTLMIAGGLIAGGYLLKRAFAARHR
jgi:hemerythrin superfamily protein